MTSVRPKLKPDQPKAVTAWETATGKVVWMAEDGSWSNDPARIGVFTGEEADKRLADAAAQEGTVTDPYFMQVTEGGEVDGRETLRETIRANGPTIHPEFQRGAE
ncbi:DUF2849 domain-containing protein [Henriciella aquimarina]|uniref:DUF2849 domain-containing protein n=1 Tax=Henriciella aquimarina TaxID=545261 RepID=UPI000A0599B1|nr:DUF2849 domain-containing protein [Henriciella aquimarina]